MRYVCQILPISGSAHLRTGRLLYDLRVHSGQILPNIIGQVHSTGASPRSLGFVVQLRLCVHTSHQRIATCSISHHLPNKYVLLVLIVPCTHSLPQRMQRFCASCVVRNNSRSGLGMILDRGAKSCSQCQAACRPEKSHECPQLQAGCGEVM